MQSLNEILGDELLSEVTTRLNGKKIIIDDGMIIPKHRFDCVNVSLRDHKQKVAQLSEENRKLLLEVNAAQNLNKSISKLQAENEILSQLLREKIIQSLEGKNEHIGKN